MDGVDPRVLYTASIYEVDGTPLVTGVELDPLVAGQTLVWNCTIPQPIIVTGSMTSQTTGEPAANTALLCREAGVGSKIGMPFVLPTAQAYVDSEGAFEMRITSGPGLYDIGIQTLTGFRALSQLQVRAGESVALNLVHPGTWSRSFLVLDESGVPLPGVSVSIVPEDSEMAYGHPEKTGNDGRVQIRDLIAGEPVTCRFQYAGREAESVSMVGEEGAESPEESIVLDSTTQQAN
jgi:hypothetical protein